MEHKRRILLPILVLCVGLMLTGCQSATAQPEDVETAQIAETAGKAEETVEETAEELTQSPSDDYILPESDTRVYTEGELSGFSADQLRLARNEIYARHGRKFDSADLQSYFDRQSWYSGTIEPEDFTEDLLNEIERQNIELIREMEAKIAGTEDADEDFEASWQVIRDYGFAQRSDFGFADSYWNDDYSYSPLSFSLIGGSATDEGEFYSVRAVFGKPVKVPADLQPGESCTVVINELTGEEKTFTAVREEGTGAEYYRTEDGWECWTTAPDSDGNAELLEGSADRLDVPFYEGVLRIRKDAVTGAAITNGPFEPVTAEGLAQDDWFNVLAFDGDGYVRQLIFEGD